MLESLPPDATLPEAENAIHPIWLAVQKALGPKTLAGMCTVDVLTAVTEEDAGICQTLMTCVGYTELKKVSQATGLLHEWIWVMLQLRDATKRVAELRAQV